MKLIISIPYSRRINEVFQQDLVLSVSSGPGHGNLLCIYLETRPDGHHQIPQLGECP